MDCEGGNPVSAPGVGGNITQVTGLTWVDIPNQFESSPHLEFDMDDRPI